MAKVTNFWERKDLLHSLSSSATASITWHQLPRWYSIPSWSVVLELPHFGLDCVGLRGVAFGYLVQLCGVRCQSNELALFTHRLAYSCLGSGHHVTTTAHHHITRHGSILSYDGRDKRQREDNEWFFHLESVGEDGPAEKLKLNY